MKIESSYCDHIISISYHSRLSEINCSCGSECEVLEEFLSTSRFPSNLTKRSREVEVIDLTEDDYWDGSGPMSKKNKKMILKMLKSICQDCTNEICNYYVRELIPETPKKPEIFVCARCGETEVSIEYADEHEEALLDLSTREDSDSDYYPDE